MAARGRDWLPLIRRLASRPDAEPDTDADLLCRFVRDRDEAAFAALVRRHGGLVLSVCRRVLQDPHEAEDVAQATWLVLARKAAALRRPQTLAAWLHGVARRLAFNARRAGERRRRREGDRAQATPTYARADPLDVLTARELLLALDEEVQRLPEVGHETGRHPHQKLGHETGRHPHQYPLQLPRQSIQVLGIILFLETPYRGRRLALGRPRRRRAARPGHPAGSAGGSDPASLGGEPPTRGPARPPAPGGAQRGRHTL